VAKAIDAEWIDEEVWRDVEWFIRNPNEALHRLAAQMNTQAHQAETQREDLGRIRAELDQFQAERDTVVALYRQGPNHRARSRPPA
jgi:hypothetical protein